MQVLSQITSTTVKAAQIKSWTEKDPTLAKVKKYCMSAWPGKSRDEQLQPYLKRKNEISIQDGCLLWGSRVIIPPQGRRQVLDLLHETHPGVSRMKSLARGYVWWPKLDQAIEEKIKGRSVSTIFFLPWIFLFLLSTLVLTKLKDRVLVSIGEK